MIVTKNLSIRRLLIWTLRPIVAVAIWSLAAAAIYEFGNLHWLTIPWLPLSLIGTAVAFYVGFKNNSAYDRLWEARKVWGAIVNGSRSWGSFVNSYVSNQFSDSPAPDHELREAQRRLVHRHIAWLYALRSQLLVVKNWEHAAQGGKTGKTAERYKREFGIGLIDDDITKDELHRFIPKEEFEQVINFQNTATQLLAQQSKELQALREADLIDDFRFISLQDLIKDFYTQQGKCERIKNYPLPRQYANSSSIFVGIFILLLPFGMLSEFSKIGEYGVWWSVPFTMLVGWVFFVMESVGDYSENPFQGMANDIPMFSLCRAIEIDLREMLGETNLPPAVESKDGILM